GQQHHHGPQRDDRHPGSAADRFPPAPPVAGTSQPHGQVRPATVPPWPARHSNGGHAVRVHAQAAGVRHRKRGGM
ncbi:unnamed protein product, partial [Lota lota]